MRPLFGYHFRAFVASPAADHAILSGAFALP